MLALIGILFPVGAPGSPDTKDVVFLVDVSPSTCTEDQVGKVPWCSEIGTDPRGFRQQFVQIAGAALRRRCPSCRLGVIAFGGTAEPIIRLDEEWRADRLVLEVRPNTDFRAAFRAALDEFHRAGTWAQGREAIIVLVSDGLPNVPGLEPEDVLKESAMILQNSEKGFSLYVYYLREEEDWASWFKVGYFEHLLRPGENFFPLSMPTTVALQLADQLVPLAPVSPTPPTPESGFHIVGLSSPRQAFAPLWQPIVCPSPDAEITLLEGKVLLSRADGYETSLNLQPDSGGCLYGPFLPDDFPPATYTVTLTGVRYQRNSIYATMPEQVEGSIRLLPSLALKIQAPLRVRQAEAVRLRVEIRNGKYALSAPELPLTLTLRLNGTEIPPDDWEYLGIYPGEPGPDDVAAEIQISRRFFRKPGVVHMECYLNIEETPDGVQIPPAWRHQEARFEVVSFWEWYRRGFLLGLLVVVLVLICVILGLLARAHWPEIVTGYALMIQPSIAPDLVTRVWTQEDAQHRHRFRTRIASYLKRIFEIGWGHRGAILQRLFYLAGRSDALREALALSLARRWEENPGCFLEESLELARHVPADLFLFAGLSPVLNLSPAYVGPPPYSEPYDLVGAESPYERALRLSRSWIPAAGRREDLKFIRKIRRYGAQPVTPDWHPWIPATNDEVAQWAGSLLHQHPVALLSLIYYEMSEGFAPDVPPQDRPHVGEVLQDAARALEKISTSLDDHSEHRQAAQQLFEFLRQVWETRAVPPGITPDQFTPFLLLPDAENLFRLLSDAARRAPHSDATRRENRQRLEYIVPPFRALVGHILEQWNAI